MESILSQLLTQGQLHQSNTVQVWYIGKIDELHELDKKIIILTISRGYHA